MCLLLGAHLLQDGENHVKGWPLAGVLVHTDADQFGDMGGDARGNVDPQSLQCNLWTNFRTCQNSGYFATIFNTCSVSHLLCMEMNNIRMRKRLIPDMDCTFMPASMGVRSAKGTSLVAISHKVTAKLHMSLALTLRSLGFFCRAAEGGE